MLKKPVWKDEKEIITYDKFSNTPIPKENPEYHGSDLGEPNRRGAFVHQNRVLITDHIWLSKSFYLSFPLLINY